jgi:hypothetical protein
MIAAVKVHTDAKTQRRKEIYLNMLFNKEPYRCDLCALARVFHYGWKPVSLLLFAVALLPAHAVAEDTLSSVLERLRVQDTRHYSYRETRHLQLLSEPWQASGDLYTSPQQMLIAQQSPALVITVISAGRMLHSDAAQGLPRSMQLEQPFAVPGMEPFMQLLYGTGGNAALDQHYVFSFDATASRWLLQLEPREHTDHAIIRMQLSGENSHGPDRLVLNHADGDRTEWQLSLLSQGAAARHELQQALERLSTLWPS